MPGWKPLGLAAAWISLAAILSPVSQYNLSPVYGSIPASRYHQLAIAAVTLLAFLSKPLLKRLLRFEARNLLPTAAFWIPLLQWFLFQLSGNMGPAVGPIVTELLTYFPVLYLTYLAAGYVLDDLLPASVRGTLLAQAGPMGVLFTLFSVIERTASRLLRSYMGSNDFLTRSGLQLLIASAYAVISRSNVLLLAMPAMIHTMFANPHYYSWSATKKLNGTLLEYNYTLWDRKDSLTGYISVLQNDKDMFRVMRCDHSLLGGEWLMTPEREQQGQNGHESIYSVFTMLEAVRLVNGASKNPDSEKDALFIGLGIGTSPAAFIRHGINTTVVELDPVVHEFAVKWFDLPTNHTAVLQDAIPFVATAAESQPASYDYIIHDVFTGGAEPTSLFTLEFLQGLDKLLKDDGIIAINYAGDLTLPPPRLVINTINAIFPTCRIYRDTPLEESSGTFINMVVFCTKSTTEPLNFRKAVESDYLGSLARRSFIPPSDQLEIKMEEFQAEIRDDGSQILKDGEEWRIEKFHPEAARRHWRIMRTVLPDEVWENW